MVSLTKFKIVSGVLLAVLALVLGGCGGDGDSNSVTPPARIPVVEQITENADFEANPIVSPDGAWILFETDVDGNLDIWRLPTAGGPAEQLTSDPATDTAPAWSPDGTSIVFESERSGNKDIWVLEVSTPGAAPIQMTFTDSDEGSPAWAGDNSRIAFESNLGKVEGSDLYTVPVGGGDLFRVTTTANGVYNRTSYWSPDSSQLVFESDVTGFSALWVVDADGTDALQITPDPSYEGHPSWSPDGTMIAFESSRNGVMEIWVVAPTGGDLFQVTTSSGYWPDWAPDGSEIIYCVFTDGQPDIWTVAVDW